MNPTNIEIMGTILFALAVIHTFLAGPIAKLAHNHKPESMAYNILHFLSEVEAVFGIWSLVFIIGYIFFNGFMLPGHEHVHAAALPLHEVLQMPAMVYLEHLNYTEPAFVFVIMCMAATRPVILLAESIIKKIAHILPFGEKFSFYVTALIVGPLLGSFITEPAAMTVTALILLEAFYSDNMSNKFKYATIGLLFVNVSVGGTLTHFAAPPVLMVAGKWHWGMLHMLSNFGYKAFVAVTIATLLFAFAFKKELSGNLKIKDTTSGMKHPPLWLTIFHLVFLALVVITAHHMVFFLGLFLFFLGFVSITGEFQDAAKLKESLLVGFFLAGLVTLGGVQGWWLQVVLSKLGDLAIYFGATALTAITDNAALTYLGSLVDLSDSAKYNLVAGAVTGGGLTVIANAPNPAGFGILKGSFGKDGIKPLNLFLGALIPTFIVIICMQSLPNLSSEHNAPTPVKHEKIMEH